MAISVSTDRSCWHKCTIGADRGGEIFDMLPRRGVQPVVPVPESAVDQFSGLSGARPQSGFAGKVSVLRMPLSSCPGLWPPSAASSGLMHSHQHRARKPCRAFVPSPRCCSGMSNSAAANAISRKLRPFALNFLSRSVNLNESPACFHSRRTVAAI